MKRAYRNQFIQKAHVQDFENQRVSAEVYAQRNGLKLGTFKHWLEKHKTTKQQRRTSQMQIAHVRNWLNSGLTQPVYARRNGLKTQTFQRWCMKHRKNIELYSL